MIFLIDDSASAREIVCVSFESEDFRVIEATDCCEGTRLFREHRPALVFADSE